MTAELPDRSAGFTRRAGSCPPGRPLFRQRLAARRKIDCVRAYFDHAATSPMMPGVLAAYTEELQRVGNPSSLHASGQAARMRLEEARETIARAVGAATPAEVVLTSGGTEADNLALKGLYWARRAVDPARRRVLLSAIEHHAVMETAEWLEAHEGAELHWLEVDAQGRVRLDAYQETLERYAGQIALVSVMLANNEIGTIQPVPRIAELARAHGIPVHTDAVQALGQIPVDMSELGVDALSLSAHKVGGPVGVGALVLARSLSPVPVLHGGGQERGVRSGTLDVAGAVAFASAVQDATADLPARAAAMRELRETLIAGILESVPGAEITGSRGMERLPGNVHMIVPGCEGDSLLFLLDSHGFDTSTGSACQAGVSRPSHVVLALGRTEDEARATQRFSLGPETTAEEVQRLLSVLPGIVERARAAGMVSATPSWAVS